MVGDERTAFQRALRTSMTLGTGVLAGMLPFGTGSVRAQTPPPAFSGPTLDNSGIIAGVNGSAGNSSSFGVGQDGGIGARVTGSGEHFNRFTGTITGGAGGAGQANSPYGNPFGGDGGLGIEFTTKISTFTNAGTIRGGSGGSGGSSFLAAENGYPSFGVLLRNGGAVINTGTIVGGRGGFGGTFTAGAGGQEAPTDGGEAVVGLDLTVVNSGLIEGGLSGDGETRASAIAFAPGTNRLVVLAGSRIVGNVIGFGSSNVLAFGGASDQTFDLSAVGPNAQFQGFTALEKIDPGTTTLTGSTAFAGSTQVVGGTLLVNGSLASSTVTVQSNAILGGTGTVGGLIATSGSSVAPGSTGVGQLNVAGNVTFRPGSTYHVEVTPTTHDVVVASGTATLQGGSVQVLAQNANYAPSTTYTILTAAAGVTGQFASVSSNLAFLEPSLAYTGTDVRLTLRRNQLAFSSVAVTPNQRQVAGAVASLPVTNPVSLALLSRSAPEARLALTQLAGEVNASQVTSSAQTAFFVQQAVIGRLTGWGEVGPVGLAGIAPGATVQAAYAADLPGGRRPERSTVPVVGELDPRIFSAWGSGFGSFGSTGGNGNAGTLTRSVGGFVVGGDATIDERWRIGIAGGYTNANFDVRSALSSGRTETGFGTVYGGARFGPVTARLGVLGSGQSTSTRRTVTFPGFADFLTARFGGTGILGFGEVGYRVDVGSMAVEPFVGGSAMTLFRDGYTERGGAAALVVLRRDYDIQTLTAGIRGSVVFAADSPFSVRGQLAYRRAFGDVVPRALLAFASGGTQFQTAGIPVDRDALVVEAGLGWQRKDVALELAYTGQIGQRADDHGAKGSFVYKF